MYIFKLDIVALTDRMKLSWRDTLVVIGESSGVKIVMDMVRDYFVFNEAPAPKISRAKARKDIEDVRRGLHEMQH